jgi:rhamnose utilization protein RhaD (predicted bifunctional aldolase and dehydrogenase)
MNKQKLRELLAVSHHYGSDPEFVLAGGGNTSYKTKSHLFIKASGAALADIGEQGFVRLRRDRLADMWQKTYPEEPQQREQLVLRDLLAAREQGQEGRRPSVETLLHDLLEASFVVHSHPPLVNALTCSREGRRAARRILGEEVVWIPAVNPGYALAAATREAVLAYQSKHRRTPDLLLFQNHGL